MYGDAGSFLYSRPSIVRPRFHKWGEEADSEVLASRVAWAAEVETFTAAMRMRLDAI
jgi:hypothetical protein